MQDENQPIDKTDQSPTPESSYNPTKEEQDLVRRCKELFARAKKAKSKVDFNWPEYYKLFRGRQWQEQRPSYRASEVFNLIFQTIQSQVPIMTDARPKFEFLPREPGDFEFADIVNDVAAADWEKYNWGFVLAEMLYDSHTFGTALSDFGYDGEKNCLDLHSVDPFYIFPAPSAENLNRHCDYIVHAEPVPVRMVKKRFPQYAKYIRGDVVNFQSAERIDLSQYRYNAPTSDFLTVEVSGFDNKIGDHEPEVLLQTTYFEDDEVLEEEKDDGAGNISYIQRKKYPNGRKVVIANDVVLENGENPYEGRHKYPFGRMVNYILSRQFWGISEIEPLESPQRTFNKIISYCVDVLVLMGNPIWVVSTDSGIDTDNLTNQQGLVVEHNPGSTVRRETGVALQPYVLALIDKIKVWFDQLGGSQDITRGIPTGGVTAALAIEDLQNAAQTRMRQKMRNMDAYLQDLGQQYVSRILQFYTAPQMFRVTGKDGVNKFFKMHISTHEETGKKIANVQKFNDNGTEGEISQYVLRGELDIRVTTGSSLPYAKAKVKQEALQLFDRGIYDDEQVLKDFDIPNWEAILQRVQHKKAQAAQLAAQAKAGQSGTAPPQAA